MSTRTVAVFGGSFNPPHLGHQMMCLYALEATVVDEICMVPTFRHPFGKALASYSHRVAMCRLAAEPFGPRVVVSEIERELDQDASRTLETLQALRSRLPDVQLRLMVGADILAERHKWYRWEEIESLAPPIVVGRAGYDHQDAREPIDVVLPDVSSTEVRARLGRGGSAVPLISRSVMDYISRAGLFR